MVSTTTASDEIADGNASVVLAGRITAYTAAPIRKSALDTLDRNPSRPVIVDASRLEYADSVGIALVFDLRWLPYALCWEDAVPRHRGTSSARTSRRG